MASVQKRTRGGRTRWVARWRDAAGRDRSKTFDKKSVAVQFAHEAERDDRSRPDLAELRRTLTVAAWLEQWLDEVVSARVRAGRLAARTAAGYESNVRVHLAPRLGSLMLDDLRVSDVDALMDSILASGKGPATARQARATLSSALTEAGRADLVDRNVARLAKPPAAPRARISTFDDDEYDRITDAAHDHRLGTAIAFGLLTGLRRSELAGPEWAGMGEDRSVWHCAIRAAPEDPVLTDAQWAEAAREVMASTGLDVGDGDGGAVGRGAARRGPRPHRGHDRRRRRTSQGTAQRLPPGRRGVPHARGPLWAAVDRPCGPDRR